MKEKCKAVALEVFLNDMRYINPRFTYLLTYLLTCNTIQTTGGLPLSDHMVSQAICQHPSLYIRTVQHQVYCILTKYTVANEMLKVGGGRVFPKEIYVDDKKFG